MIVYQLGLKSKLRFLCEGECIYTFPIAMNKMNELMLDPIKMKSWFDEKESEFNALPED